MMSDTTEDLRIGPEILKQQAELYRRLRNTLRWILGSLDGFTDAERVPDAEMPELERWILHRLTEIDARVRAAVTSYDWTGVYPDLHNFCSVDLSAFYFDVRKDAIYCDRPDSLRRRAARTVLDHLHRYLCTWLAPVLCFTAEEAWGARFGDDTSVHLEQFQTPPAAWRDDALAAKWETIRAIRRRITVPIEEARKANTIGSSLQAAIELPLHAEQQSLLDEAAWSEIAIVSSARIVSGTDESLAKVMPAPGEKCARCWRVLEEVGTQSLASVAVPPLHGRGGVGPDLQTGLMPRRLVPLGLLAGLVVLVADQASKWWVLYVLNLPELRQVVLLPVLNLTMVWNRGVTFGLLNGFGAWGHLILVAVALAVVAALWSLALSCGDPSVAMAIGAIAGGAVGNVHRPAAFWCGRRFHSCPRGHTLGRPVVVRLQCRGCCHRLRRRRPDHRLANGSPTRPGPWVCRSGVNVLPLDR